MNGQEGPKQAEITRVSLVTPHFVLPTFNMPCDHTKGTANSKPVDLAYIVTVGKQRFLHYKALKKKVKMIFERMLFMCQHMM